MGVFPLILCHWSHFWLIFASYWGCPLVQFSKFKNFLWVCWFLCKILSNFVSLPWKLHNPYCHRPRYTLGKQVPTLETTTTVLFLSQHHNFSDFRSGQSDSLTIYDGGSNTSQMLGDHFCGDTLPPNQISSGNQLFIHFHSDSWNTGTGFKFEYNAISKIPWTKLQAWE